MKNKTSKILISIILIFSIFSLFIPTVKASELSESITEAGEFLNKGTQDVPIAIDKMSDTIYNVLLIIGIVVAVIIGMMLGIRFITGSVGEKAKIKEQLIVYIAGCVVIFGAFTIWKLVVTILQSTN